MSSTVNTISTFNAGLDSRRRVAQVNRDLSIAEKELSTGLKADAFDALGGRSYEALALRTRMDRNEGLSNSNKLLAARLDFTALTLSDVRDTAQDFLNLAVPNRSAPSGTVDPLSLEAGAALEQMIARLNVSYQGAFLYSGTTSDVAPMQKWSEVNPATGKSPRDVVQAIVGGGIGNAADAAAKVAQMNAVYQGTAVDPTTNYEATFYNGTPQQTPGGVPEARLEARIESELVLPYGVQANDRPYVQVMQGMAMIAATDVSQIADAGGYETWVSAAVDLISQGIAGMIETESRLGGQQVQLENTQEVQESRRLLYNTQIVALEGADPYEAASRVTALQTQLEATYTISARITRLSFLNYL